MKHIVLLAACTTAALAGFGQSDSTQTDKPDTIKIGSMTIIKKKDGSSTTTTESKGTKWYTGKRKPKRVETSWLNFDFGFNNFVDETDYSSPEAQQFARATRPGEPPFSESDFNLHYGKSINTNIWFFRQHFRFTNDRKMRLTYGLFLETNNYRFDPALRTSYQSGKDPFVWRDSINFRKNKLALDYLTVPLMVGFDTRPGRRGFSIGAGVSMGYLYNSRNKQVSNERGKLKNRGNFDVEVWKFQYIGEIGTGPVKLYFSYAPSTVYERGLIHKPYNVGIRLGDWQTW